MIKKIFNISLLTLLVLANLSVAFAIDLEPDFDYNSASSCVQECLGDNTTPNSRRLNRCVNSCNADTNPTNTQACQTACMNCSSFEFSARSTATSEQVTAAKESACERECRANPTFSCNTLPPIPKPDLLPGPDIGLNPTGEDVVDYVSDRVLPKLANRLISLISVIAIIMLVVSGVMMVAATGNEDQIKKARSTALFAALGLGLALLSFAIIDIINNLNLST